MAISASVLDHEQGEFLNAGFDAFVGKPFRVREVCACMETLLQVRFEYPVAEEVREAPPDPASLVLPAVLLDQLKDAARRFSATRLEAGLQALEAAGFGSLARHLRDLTDAGQFRDISAFLAEVRIEAPKI